MQQEHSHLAVGTNLKGIYTIKKKLGSGGFGITYLAQNNLGKEYVLKEMYLKGEFVRKENGTISLQGLSKANYEKYKQRFIREAQTLQRLSGHEHIVNVENYFEENNTVYIVMEYLRGQSLEEMVAQKGRMSESEALGYIKQVASALSYIHAQNFYHRDVKPANIMITDGQAKLIDFGISKKVDEDIEVSKYAAFSPSYASIEQQDSNSEINAAMDVYSLTATLYYCLMGQKPQKALTRLRQQEKELDLSAIRLSPNIAQALQKGMALYEGNRYPSVDALLQALHTKSSPSPPTPPPKEEEEGTVLRSSDYLALGDGFYQDGAYEKAIANYQAITPNDPKYDYAQSQIKRSKEALAPPPKPMNKLMMAGIGLLIVMGGMMMWWMNSGETNQTTSKAKTTDKVANKTTTKSNEKPLPTGMKLIKVEGGTFKMGEGGKEDDEKPPHDVTLTSFQLSETEVTNAQYAEFLRAKKPSKTEAEKWIEISSSACKITSSYGVEAGYEDHPVVEVSWYGAKAFCEYYGGRLPTEAEWEYAARGGNKSKGYTYSGSNTLSEVAWYEDNSGRKPNKVGLKKGNELGFKDMSGNVYEWCSDWWHGNYNNAPKDGRSWESANGGDSSRRHLRGGSCFNVPSVCRVADRSGSYPENQYGNGGFRFSRTI